MELFETILPRELMYPMGWTLVHFLWQGILAAVLLWVLLRILRYASSTVRYGLACLGLWVLVSMPVITFIILYEPPVKAPALPAAKVTTSQPMPAVTAEPVVVTAQMPSVPPRSLKAVVVDRIDAAIPTCVLLWAAGVASLSLWYLGGWCQLQKLRRMGIRPVSEAVEAKASELAGRLGVRRVVRVVESVLVQVPTVIGVFKPIVLLPASALTGLEPVQLSALIAHELAHIKRCDYLVNILQTIVEILGFYHPALWWMSRQIRIERENCCDDVAVNLLQSKKDYAVALFSMAQIRRRQLELAIAANGGHLTHRINRLASGKSPSPQKKGWIPSIITMLLIAGLLITSSLAMSNKTTKKSDPIENEDVRVYEVNKNVSDFPEAEDFSTPESAYAAINRVMAVDDAQGWLRVSGKDLLSQAEKPSLGNVDPEWATVVLNAQILEVRISDDEAVVIAEFPQALSSTPIRKPIDYRHLKLEGGRWLNDGENRYDTVEQAREKFATILKKPAPPKSPYDLVMANKPFFTGWQAMCLSSCSSAITRPS